jgi:hypothetical protein
VILESGDPDTWGENGLKSSSVHAETEMGDRFAVSVTATPCRVPCILVAAALTVDVVSNVLFLRRLTNCWFVTKKSRQIDLKRLNDQAKILDSQISAQESVLAA